MVIDDSTHAQQARFAGQGNASQRQSLDNFAGQGRTSQRQSLDTFAGQGRASQRQSVDRTGDQTTHAGGQARPLLQKKRSKTNVLGKKSFENELPYSTKQSSVINVPPLGRRSIGERVKALSRSSLDSRTGSGELDRVSATHYGGQTPTMVPVRSSTLGAPEQMIVDPTTHAEAGFRKRRSVNLDGVISNV